jgi:hypothetical protein
MKLKINLNDADKINKTGAKPTTSEFTTTTLYSAAVG